MTKERPCEPSCIHSNGNRFSVPIPKFASIVRHDYLPLAGIAEIGQLVEAAAIDVAALGTSRSRVLLRQPSHTTYAAFAPNVIEDEIDAFFAIAVDPSPR